MYDDILANLTRGVGDLQVCMEPSVGVALYGGPASCRSVYILQLIINFTTLDVLGIMSESITGWTS